MQATEPLTGSAGFLGYKLPFECVFLQSQCLLFQTWVRQGNGLFFLQTMKATHHSKMYHSPSLLLGSQSTSWPVWNRRGLYSFITLFFVKAAVSSIWTWVNHDQSHLIVTNNNFIHTSFLHNCANRQRDKLSQPPWFNDDKQTGRVAKKIKDFLEPGNDFSLHYNPILQNRRWKRFRWFKGNVVRLQKEHYCAYKWFTWTSPQHQTVN